MSPDASTTENFDAIITNAAGCGSTLKEYDHLFTEKEPEYAQASAFKSKVRDITEFLANLGVVTPLRPLKPLQDHICRGGAHAVRISLRKIL